MKFFILLFILIIGCSHTQKKTCVHTVRFYAGDSYWKQYVRFNDQIKNEYIERFGVNEFYKLVLGQETTMQKREGEDCD